MFKLVKGVEGCFAWTDPSRLTHSGQSAPDKRSTQGKPLLGHKSGSGKLMFVLCGFGAFCLLTYEKYLLCKEQNEKSGGKMKMVCLSGDSWVWQCTIALSDLSVVFQSFHL